MALPGARHGAFVRMFGSAIVVQALLSATNFIVGLILIRRTTNVDYGYYVLVTATALLVTGLQNAYIQPPLVIRMTPATREQRAELIGGIWRGQRRILAIVAGLAALLVVLLGASGMVTTDLALLGLSSVFALSAALFRDFFRTVLLSYRRSTDVLKADVCYGGLLLLLVPLATLTPLPAMAAVAGVGVAAVAGGILLARALWLHEPWNRAGPMRMLRELAPLGTWSALGSATHWSFSQGYNYVVAGTLDVAAVAALAATRLLMMPVNLLSGGIGSLMMATATSWLHAHGSRELFRRLLLIACGLGALASIYFFAIWWLRDLIFWRLMHKQFAQSGLMVAAWSAVFLVMIFRDQLNFVPGASGLHRRLMGVTAAAAVVSLVAGYVAIRQLGALGAPLGVLLGELCNLAGIICLSVLEMRRRRD